VAVYILRYKLNCCGLVELCYITPAVLCVRQHTCSSVSVLSVYVNSNAHCHCVPHCHKLTGTNEDRSDTIPHQRCMQQALHDCTSALNAYSAHSSNAMRHQQTASSDSSSSSSSNDYLSHMPGFASTVAAAVSWLLINA
jgi:hypothetical protein